MRKLQERTVKRNLVSGGGVLPQPALEIADLFRARGPAWRRVNARHVSLGQPG